MSQEKEIKKVGLSKSSASFIPKALKQKANETTAAQSNNVKIQTKQNVGEIKSPEMMIPENTLKFNPSISWVIPPQPTSLKIDKPMGMMQFPPLIGGQINLNDLLPFAPIKPPPLLFSQLDDFLTMDLQNTNLTSQEPKKLKIITYSADFILSFKDKFKNKPAEMKEMDMPTKFSHIKKHFKGDGELKFFKGRERGYSNFSNSSTGFKGL